MIWGDIHPSAEHSIKANRVDVGETWRKWDKAQEDGEGAD